MSLDAATLITSVVIAEFAGAVILGVFWLTWWIRGAGKSTSLLFWMIGLLFAGTGTELIALRGAIPDYLSIVLANGFVLIGAGLRCAGLAVFLQRKPLIWVTIAIVAMWFVFCLYPPFLDSFMARVYFVQAVLIVMCLRIVVLAFGNNKQGLYSVYMIGMATLVECSGYIWFSVNQHIMQYPTFLATFPNSFMTVYLLTALFGIIMTVVLPACTVIERNVLAFMEQALRDPLTGLPNRRAFLNDTNDWTNANAGSDKNYSLIMFDLDRFKTINDKFGHAMGDAVLQLFGRIVQETNDMKAISGRIGGEEFVVFLPEAKKDQAYLIAQRICTRFSKDCLEASAGRLNATASVGVVATNVDMSLEQAMEGADQGVYMAKRAGRAQIVTVDPAEANTVKPEFGPDTLVQNTRSASTAKPA
ncbi:MAG: GGDEF domain-containing protein [Roseibium sp.]